MNEFKKMKYGMFIHYVASAALRPDGSRISDANESADSFNVESFANDLASFGVEYIVFTAWHFNMVCLYPSNVMGKWLNGHTVKRDLIREIITVLKEKGIKVILYTHPRDGHDFSESDSIAVGWGHDRDEYKPNPNPSTFNFTKWNDFINDVYGELVDRYGNDIEGIYLDEGSEKGDSEWIVDYERLRKTIKGRNPNLVMLQNYYGNIYTCDFGDKEFCHYDEFASSDSNLWPCYTMPVAPVFSKSWAANSPVGINSVPYSVEGMFKYTVLQAGSNIDGGGVQWATGPYATGGWETGVSETMLSLYKYIEPISQSIIQTFPSTSFITEAGTTLGNLSWGVATKSTDDRHEYLHVLKPPISNTLALPLPADGKRFASAIILNADTIVKVSNEDSNLVITLPDNYKWGDLCTTIDLSVI